mmetsp:Transcript_68665/g.135852  ORF Transcript_68665/g.135852 Transcript_68665/m.135852 type:complete len:129 (-) Transcript_68665:1006-1392(-)
MHRIAVSYAPGTEPTMLARIAPWSRHTVCNRRVSSCFRRRLQHFADQCAHCTQCQLPAWPPQVSTEPFAQPKLPSDCKSAALLAKQISNDRGGKWSAAPTALRKSSEIAYQLALGGSWSSCELTSHWL